MSGNERLWAVVPVKPFARAKRRLMPVLSFDERTKLTCAMLADVLTALTNAPCLAGVIVVTSERDAGTLAQAAGAIVMSEGKGTGMNAAVTKAARRLNASGAIGMLAIPADVPRITTPDIEAIALAHRAAPSVTLVPATKDGGTNALACSPPLAVPCRFGRDSLRKHQEAARAGGIAAQLVCLERFCHDIDRPDDLAEFALRPSPTRTHAYLVASGIAERVRDVRQHRHRAASMERRRVLEASSRS
ncbi:MAG TPA: 2-phospho-L-lactate guanylyltransferase [Burkholderiales bacterium]|nr:2-phospho-L-lactate guanylyltransferase [Burkholderiales bacterium]